MFFYILKMHAFQATIYYEKINAIYNSNSTLLDQEEERLLENGYKQSIRSLKFNHFYMIFFILSSFFVLAINLILAFAFGLNFYNTMPYLVGTAISGSLYFIMMVSMIFISYTTAQNFKNILYEGNEKAQRKANILIVINIVLLLLNAIY